MITCSLLLGKKRKRCWFHCRYGLQTHFYWNLVIVSHNDTFVRLHGVRRFYREEEVELLHEIQPRNPSWSRHINFRRECVSKTSKNRALLHKEKWGKGYCNILIIVRQSEFGLKHRNSQTKSYDSSYCIFH